MRGEGGMEKGGRRGEGEGEGREGGRREERLVPSCPDYIQCWTAHTSLVVFLEMHLVR